MMIINEVRMAKAAWSALPSPKPKQSMDVDGDNTCANEPCWQPSETSGNNTVHAISTLFRRAYFARTWDRGGIGYSTVRVV